MGFKFALVRIPPEVSFEQLNLHKDEETGKLAFSGGVLRAILDANENLVFRNEQEIVDLLRDWYANLRRVGYFNEVAEEVFAPAPSWTKSPT